jgi:hypothetical protein
MDIKGFFKDARRKGPSKGTSAPVESFVEVPAPASEPEIDPAEANLVQAAMGLNFKCGICHKPHKSSHREKVKGLAKCVGKILKDFGEKQYGKGQRYGDKDVSNGLGVRFLPDPETADTMVFTFKQYNAFTRVIPTSSAVEALYPTLKKRFATLNGRLNEVFGREIIEEISLKEALGAPHTLPYLRAREKSFKERATEEFAQIKKDQEAFDPETWELARNWRKLTPEKFKVGEMERGYATGSGHVAKWFKNATPSVEPIQRVKINGKEHGADTILSWFFTMSGDPVWDTNYTGSSAKVLYDVGTVDGFPAISWALVGSKDEGGNRRTVHKGSNIMHFVTLWSGKMFLNMFGRREEFSLSYFSGNRKRYVSVSLESESFVADKAD